VRGPRHSRESGAEYSLVASVEGSVRDAPRCFTPYPGDRRRASKLLGFVSGAFNARSPLQTILS
jgi:hypothetical protein